MTVNPPVVLSIDFETASEADLKKVGAWRYSTHLSTRVLCMSYSFDGGKTVKNWREGQFFPAEVLDHVERGGIVRAWNAAFEYAIWNNTLMRGLGQHTAQPDAPMRKVPLGLSQLEDTMAAAAYWGLPLSLDQAGPAAGLPFKKDKDGHRLMMQLCKPRKHRNGTTTWWHEDEPAKFDRLVDYCDQDVRVEAGIAAVINPLPKPEREMWVLDQLINLRGVTIDLDLVRRLRDLAEEAGRRANAIIDRMTGGQVKTVTSTAALLSYLQTNTAYPYANLQKATIAARLDDPACFGLERDLLELRSDNAKTSVAKLNAMLNAAEPDPTDPSLGVVYGMLQYYGASRTGRWAGRLIQMQNMPRGVIDADAVPHAIAAIKAGAVYDLVEALFGSVMGVVSSCLRGCIVSATGTELVVPDFSQIEARVLPWLAGQDDILDVFQRGDDVYVYTAASIGSSSRQLGKVLVLACGFGMSSAKFKTTAEGYRVFLTDQEADDAVKAWRAANDKTVAFWWALDAAARAVLSGRAAYVDVGPHIRIGMLGNDMIIRLPSGRHLVYRDAQLRDNPDRPGTQEITYMGVDQYTKRWTRLRTYGGKLAENVTQAVARDVMAEAMKAAARQGVQLILTVHDELLSQFPIADAAAGLALLLGLMRTPPVWASGLPVNAAGWFGPRYKKD